jgi:23S rRNA (cytosine1962-C5)-methyltransferase
MEPPYVGCYIKEAMRKHENTAVGCQPVSRSETKPVPRLRLRVTTAAEAEVRSGHPWVFAESIREQNRAGELGELAVIYDRQDRFLAVGLFDPESPIRMRVLHCGKPQTIDRAWWEARLESALERRQGLFDKQTTGFRWINGESDGWPGLVLDRYGQNLVLKLYAASWAPRLDEITNLIVTRLRPERLVLRLSRNIQPVVANLINAVDGQVLAGPPLDGPVVFRETGLKFEADLLHGQKTGFFLDQRENRRKVESLAKGRRVLNAFSFSGGFSLYAARAGAQSVMDLDISSHALEASNRNFELNQSEPAVRSCRHNVTKAEVFEWLEKKSGSKFDLIILDPPSLARRELERAGAIIAYGKLARLGIKRLEPEGILAASSCSAHVTADEFFGAVRGAAVKSGRHFRELGKTRHPPDHPATFSAAQYLKTLYLIFS